MLTFWGMAKLFSKLAAPFSFPPAISRDSMSPYPHHHLLPPSFLVMAISGCHTLHQSGFGLHFPSLGGSDGKNLSAVWETSSILDGRLPEATGYTQSVFLPWKFHAQRSGELQSMGSQKRSQVRLSDNTEMTNIKYLFVYLVICVSSMKQCLFRSFAYFFFASWVVFSYWAVKILIHTHIHTNPLSDIWFIDNTLFCGVFSPSWW